jgi:hypothetical protein
VEAEHQELLKAYIVDIARHEGISNPQVTNAKEVQATKKRPKVAPCQISSFFGNPIPYKKHEKHQKKI